jgi:hypothetical protein
MRSSHTHAHNHVMPACTIFLSQPFPFFVMLRDRFAEAAAGAQRGQLMVFLTCFASFCLETFSFFSSHSYSTWCSIFSVLLLLCVVRAPFSLKPTNAYLIATIFDGLGTVVIIEFSTVTIKPD